MATNPPETLLVEDLERAFVGDLDDGGRVEAVDVIAVSRLDEYRRVRLALGKERALVPHVGQLHP